MGSEAEWESHKSKIQHLYLSEDKPLNSVIEIMANSHGFNASKARYERHFKVWGFRKNLKSHEWKAIHHHLSKRKRVGKESELYVDGILVPTKKLRKETLRNSFVPSSEQHARGTSPEMPEQIIVRTPGALEADWFPTENLPWFLLESSLEFLVNQTLTSATATSMFHPDRNNALARGLRQHFARNNVFHSIAHHTEDRGSGVVDSMFQAPGGVSTRSIQLISSKLFCMMPESRVGGHLASARKILGPLNQDATLQLIKLTLYSLSNNLFEWTDGEYKVVQWLRREENIHFLEVLLSTKGPTTEAFSEALFQVAIRAGDIQLIRTVIRTGLNPNEQVIYSAFQLHTPLQYASEKGNAQLAHILLSSGAHVNAKERLSTAWCGQTPLELAAMAGAKDVVNLLLDAGAEVNGLNDSSALEIAVKHGHTECAQILLSAGADVDAIGHGGIPALHTAAKNEDVKLVETLLAAGADVTAVGIFDETVLEVAVEHWNAEIIHILLNAGIGEFENALYYAVEAGDMKMVQTLLHAGADVNCSSFVEETALTAAAARGDIDMVRLLLNAGANVNGEVTEDFDRHKSVTSLQAAAQNEELEVAQLLLDGGALVNASAPDGQLVDGCFSGTALQIAAYYGNVEMSRLLLDTGADVNGAPAESGSTALQAAVQSQKVLLVQMMLDARAHINTTTTDDEGRTALQSAIEGKNHLIIQSILNAGADINAPATGKGARTPLQSAIEGKMHWLIQHLLKAGADVDGLPAKEHGTTALNAAIRIEDIKLVRSLLDAGADVNNPAAKLWGETALETAAANNDTDLVQNLLDIGADTDDPAALLVAVENRNVELIQVLLAAHVGVNGLRRKTYGSIALQAAVKNKDYDIVRIILNAGVGVNTRASSFGYVTHPSFYCLGIRCNCQWIGSIACGAPALARAVGTEDLAMVRLLLEAGADPNIKSLIRLGLYEATALSTAIGRGNVPLAKMLIEASADPNIEFSYLNSFDSPKTALLRAVDKGNPQLVKMLLEAGADVNNAPTKAYGRNPLQLAAERGCVEIVQMLLIADADANALASEAGGATALQAAAIGGYFGIVCMLLKAGADVNATPTKENGRTALEGAAERGRIDILQLLLDSGASIEGAGRGQYDRAIKFATEQGHNAARRLLQAYHDSRYAR